MRTIMRLSFIFFLFMTILQISQNALCSMKYGAVTSLHVPVSILLGEEILNSPPGVILSEGKMVNPPYRTEYVLPLKDVEFFARTVPVTYRNKIFVVGEKDIPKDFSANMQSFLFALDITKRRIIWTHVFSERRYVRHMLTNGKLVFILSSAGNAEIVEAFSADDGKLVWTSPKMKDGMRMAYANDHLYVRTYVHNFKVIDIHTGQIIDSIQTAPKRPSTCLSNRRYFHISWPHLYYSALFEDDNRLKVYDYDLSQRKMKWTRVLPGSDYFCENPPISEHNGRIFVGCSMAYDAKTGRPLWKKPRKGRFIDQFFKKDELLCVESMRDASGDMNRFRILAVQPATGEFEWEDDLTYYNQFRYPHVFLSLNDTILVGDQGNLLKAYTKTGKKKWSYRFYQRDKYTRWPLFLLYKNNKIYVISNDKSFYILSPLEKDKDTRQKSPMPDFRDVHYPTAGGGNERRAFVDTEPLRQKPILYWRTYVGNFETKYVPVASHGRLYVATDNGILLSFDMQTGRRLWGVKPKGGVIYSNGDIYVLNDRIAFPIYYHVQIPSAVIFQRDVYFLDPETGKVLCHRAFPADNRGYGLVMDKPAHILFTFLKKGYAFRTSDCSLVWETKEKRTELSMSGPPLLYQDKIIVVMNHFNDPVYAYRIKDGQEVWKTEPPQHDVFSVWTRPVAHEKFIFIPTIKNGLYALRPTDGKIVWRKTLPGEQIRGLAVASSILIVTLKPGQILALRPDTGKIVWKASLKEKYEVPTSPVIAQNTVYVGTSGGRLYAVDLDSGNMVWVEERFGRGVWVYPPIPAHRFLFVLGGDNYLYAFGPQIAK